MQEAEMCKRLELYSTFSAFVYSLETFVPLLRLEVSRYWLPNANRGKEIPGLREFMLKMAIQLLFGKKMSKLGTGPVLRPCLSLRSKWGAGKAVRAGLVALTMIMNRIVLSRCVCLA
jgi:hypothetical protein